MYDTPYDTASTADSAAAAAMMVPMMLFWLAVTVFMLAAMWKIYTKAGKPGWAAIVPIYNNMVMAEIVGRPSWVGLMMLVPVLNLYVSIILTLDLAKSFGKSVGFGVLSIFFPFITLPILAFGSAKYMGPVSQGKTLEP